MMDIISSFFGDKYESSHLTDFNNKGININPRNLQQDPRFTDPEKT